MYMTKLNERIFREPWCLNRKKRPIKCDTDELDCADIVQRSDIVGSELHGSMLSSFLFIIYFTYIWDDLIILTAVFVRWPLAAEIKSAIILSQR